MKAIVTAGTRGIGKAIAVELSKTAEVKTIARTGDFAFDLTGSFAAEDAAEMVLREFGYPDIVIHNLGGALGITNPFCLLEDWERVFRLNLGVAVEMNRIFVPGMQARKWGRVVHVSSVSALENQGTVPYCSMKAALNAYVRSFGRFVAKDGVCVSAVMPGAVFTEGGYWDHPRAEAFVKERMAIGRLGTVEEIAKFVGFLCSEAASFVAGSCFLVDGGQGRAFEQAA